MIININHPVQRLRGQSPECLSPRECEMVLLTRSLTNDEIATRLCVSPNTVKATLHTAFCKLGARRRTEAYALLCEMEQERRAA